MAAANQVYSSCLRFLYRAYQSGALITLENPVRSWLLLVKQHGPQSFIDWYFALQDYDFDACMFGSQRAKATRIKGTPGVFEGLQKSCDNSHAHLPWKPTRLAGRWVFPTKEEAEYTPPLCQFLCSKATAAVQSSQIKPALRRSKVLRAHVRAAAQQQTKATQQLVPEFRCTVPFADVEPGMDYKLIVKADSSRTGVKADPSAVPT